MLLFLSFSTMTNGRPSVLSGWHFLALQLVALPKTIEVACSLGDGVLSAFPVV